MITDFDKSFNRMKLFITLFIGILFVLILGFYIAIAMLGYKALVISGEQDWSKGIKPVIEKMWCGEPGCLNGQQ